MLRLQSRRRSEIFRASRLTAAISLVVLLPALPLVILGQELLSSRQRESLASVPNALPGDLLLRVRPLGARMQIPGREETVFTGQLIDATGNSRNVRIIHQLSGMVRIEGLRERPLAFDGEFAWGLTDRTDESLLETFVTDTIEGMIYAFRSGGAIRLLGRGFGPDPRRVPDYKGPRYDIYEVVAPVRSRQEQQLRMKRYYFESQTGLLASTRYVDPTMSGLNVETRFSNWQQTEGSAYPGRIERFENGYLVFTYVAATASSQPRHDAASFR